MINLKDFYDAFMIVTDLCQQLIKLKNLKNLNKLESFYIY